MADALVTFASRSDDAPNVAIAAREYELAERQMVLGKFASVYQLEQRMGTTLRVTRTKRLNLPTAPLTEGVAPDSSAFTLEKVDVTVEQWGIVVAMTDVSMLTLTHPVLAKAITLVGMAIAEVGEREIAKILMGGTNVTYGGTAASRDLLVATDVATSRKLLTMTVAMRTAGGMPTQGNTYGGVMPPQMEGDLLDADSTFKDAQSRQNIAGLEYGDLGVWMGISWKRGNFLPSFKGVATPTTAAVTAEKAQFTDQATGGGFNTDEIVKLVVVARDAQSDYERKISQTATITIGGVGATARSVDVKTASSTAYTYDIYASAVTNGAAKLWRSRVAASTTVTLTDFSDVSASAAAPPVAPGLNVETYVAWVFAKDAYMRVELNGMSLRSYRTPEGPSHSDPLAQVRKIGSKYMWKCAILDDAFLRRLEFGSSFPSGLPA